MLALKVLGKETVVEMRQTRNVQDERALILFWLPCHFLNFRFVPAMLAARLAISMYGLTDLGTPCMYPRRASSEMQRRSE